MDSSSHDNSSWLAFSLSNHTHHHHHHSHLSLFEAFSSPNAATVVDSTTADQHHPHHVFTGGPKLEDFLGGGQLSAADQTTPVSMSSSDNNNNNIITTRTTNPESVTYDSPELKTIAASFLRGYESSNYAGLTPVTTGPPENSPTAASKKAVDTFGQRTSIYRGVTRHRWTGRYEAHLWDNSCRREGQSRKGRQVYLGGYDKEDKAARAYDLAALKYWGPTTTTNVPVSNYEKELDEMKNMTRQEFVASLRRKSSGFSRGASIYRGVTRHHQHGRWQARIGRVAGNKDLYLGTFSTQEEAAEAYDIAAIKFRGLNAVTNFDMGRYDVKSIATTNLPVGGLSNAGPNKPKSTSSSSERGSTAAAASSASTLSFAIPSTIKQDPAKNTTSSPDSNYWPNIFGFQNPSTTVDQNPSAVVLPLTTTTPTGSTMSHDYHHHHQQIMSNDFNNIGGFFSYNNNNNNNNSHHVGTSCTNTVPFAVPINNNNGGYEISSPSGYNVNHGFGWNYNNNNVGPSLHSFHHQTHAKPSTLFQTPIFGAE